MSYDIFLAEFFKRNIKILKKKYPNVSNDLRVALRVICENPGLGKSLRGFGDIKKLRVRNSDVTKGKRIGYRLIYFADHSRKMIYPLLMYSKSEKDEVTIKEIKSLLESLARKLD